MCVTDDIFEALKKEAESEKNWHCEMTMIGHTQESSPPVLLNLVNFIKNNNIVARILYVNNASFKFETSQSIGISKKVVKNIKKSLIAAARAVGLKLVMKQSRTYHHRSHLHHMVF